MQNLIILYDSFSDGAELAGGYWSLPLTNLQQQGIRKVARSNGVDPDDTKFTVTFAGPKEIKAVCLGPSNLTSAYSYRLSGSSFDTGWQIGQPQEDWNTLNWTDQNFWLGVEAWEDSERGIWIVHIFDDPIITSSLLVEIDDRINPDEFVQFGRLFIGQHWQPSRSYTPASAGLSFRDNSIKSSNLVGGERFWRRINPRVMGISLPPLGDDELFDDAYELQRISGYNEEVFVIPDPDDQSNLLKRSFLATMTKMDPLSQIIAGYGTTAFEFKEVI